MNTALRAASQARLVAGAGAVIGAYTFKLQASRASASSIYFARRACLFGAEQYPLSD